MESYSPGDIVIYQNDGLETCEIGVVKSVTENGCFVWYHLGATCSKTLFENLRKISNDYVLQAQLDRARLVRSNSRFDHPVDPVDVYRDGDQRTWSEL